MPKKKRKKYPRLPSGFGSIRYLGEGRRNCYAVTLPATIDKLGRTVRPTPLCYVDDWYKGFAVLTAYKAGTYSPGMEKSLDISPTTDRDAFCERVIADLSLIKGLDDKASTEKEMTFSEVFDAFYKWKFESPKGKMLSQQSRRGYRAAYKNCVPLYDRPFTQIKAPELQAHLDSVKLKHGSLEHILVLWKQMYKYAIMSEICTDDKSRFVSVSIPEDDEHGVPLSEDDLRMLWKNQSNEDVQMILIMCYSGFRITEYCKMEEVNLTDWYFKGGIKTAAGIGRYVPIHTAIRDLVSARIDKYGVLIPWTDSNFRQNHFMPTLKKLGIFGHTPHDCRHTFSMLCEKYGVTENDRKRMLGHAFQNDITNAVYGHRTVEDLRAEIEKIKIPEI